jgi:hypothetical protein
MNDIKPERKLTIRIFALASFLNDNDVESDIIYPISPFFVTSFLGTALLMK